MLDYVYEVPLAINSGRYFPTPNLNTEKKHNIRFRSELTPIHSILSRKIYSAESPYLPPSLTSTPPPRENSEPTLHLSSLICPSLPSPNTDSRKRRRQYLSHLPPASLSHSLRIRPTSIAGGDANTTEKRLVIREGGGVALACLRPSVAPRKDHQIPGRNGSKNRSPLQLHIGRTALQGNIAPCMGTRPRAGASKEHRVGILKNE